MSILIKNGFVIDPANGVNGKLNILVADGKIKQVSDMDIAPEACDDQPCTVIDATGKYVAPGFIDIHMHEDTLTEDGSQIQTIIGNFMLKMGVTTVVAGNCGENQADPIKYLDIVEKNGYPVNLALQAGHDYIRQISGQKDKYAKVDDQCLDRMKANINAALDAGCIGLSYGLRYTPGTDKREFWETSSCCHGKDKIISIHVRDDADYIVDALDEVIAMCEEYDIALQISHLGSMAGFGQMEKALQIIDSCKARNLDVSTDCYPYYAFSTRIGATTYDEGFRERYNIDYSAIELGSGKYKGQRCTEEIFHELRAEAPDTITICHVMKHEDVDMALTHPHAFVASDGLLNQGQGHPRAAGTFPRFIKNYVKTGKISLYNGIAKMTSLPAAKLKLSNKGRLNVGADGDLVIFDLDTIQDNATFTNPDLPPDGIDYVIINGQIALQGGDIVNGTLGTAIRKY